MSERPIIYPDADLEDADWTKTTWDLPTDADTWWDVPLDELRALMKLPAWNAAPDNVRRIVTTRLAE
jgi:hypothetical protein